MAELTDLELLSQLRDALATPPVRPDAASLARLHATLAELELEQERDASLDHDRGPSPHSYAAFNGTSATSRRRTLVDPRRERRCGRAHCGRRRRGRSDQYAPRSDARLRLRRGTAGDVALPVPRATNRIATAPGARSHDGSAVTSSRSAVDRRNGDPRLRRPLPDSCQRRHAARRGRRWAADDLHDVTVHRSRRR